jgi:hypothetical protein
MFTEEGFEGEGNRCGVVGAHASDHFSQLEAGLAPPQASGHAVVMVTTIRDSFRGLINATRTKKMTRNRLRSETLISQLITGVLSPLPRRATWDFAEAARSPPRPAR